MGGTEAKAKLAHKEPVPQADAKVTLEVDALATSEEERAKVTKLNSKADDSSGAGDAHEQVKAEAAGEEPARGVETHLDLEVDALAANEADRTKVPDFDVKPDDASGAGNANQGEPIAEG